MAASTVWWAICNAGEEGRGDRLPNHEQEKGSPGLGMQIGLETS